MREAGTSKRVAPFLCLVACLACLPPSSAQEGAAREYQLGNGLKLIVKEDHRSPIVVSQIWYKVGSSYEPNGITGISHALEHMMFKGTKKHPPGEFSRLISEQGGRENAFTGSDYTAYFQELERGRLAVSFELEADRMRNLTLLKDEFAKEIQVVIEERRMRTDDNPQSLTQEMLAAGAFASSPYHHPVIGWRDDLDHMTADDVRQWYNAWYAPNNAALVVVGDVEPDAVFRLARKYFGGLKPGRITEPKPRAEAPQLGERRIVVKTPARVPYVALAYKTPALRTAQAEWEPFALEVLAGILDGGGSSRLQRHLVRDSRIAADAAAEYDLYSRYDNLFQLDGTPATGHTAAELETALRRQVQRLREEPVTDDELERVKAQVVANDVYQRDSVFYQAMLIGMLETVGLDWRWVDRYVDAVRAVTAEQVREVARKYLVDDHLTVAVLEPLPIGAGTPESEAPPSRDLR
jgi:zinc protease